ncbi:hypothetical protein C8R46DRAFT_1048503 [Mycena filopes]|nr:hypothetical protein C8R46DRAFT_1048503 [Mycena filopes]
MSRRLLSSFSFMTSTSFFRSLQRPVFRHSEMQRVDCWNIDLIPHTRRLLELPGAKRLCWRCRPRMTMLRWDRREVYFRLWSRVSKPLSTYTKLPPVCCLLWPRASQNETLSSSTSLTLTANAPRKPTFQVQDADSAGIDTILGLWRRRRLPCRPPNADDENKVKDELLVLRPSLVAWIPRRTLRMFLDSGLNSIAAHSTAIPYDVKTVIQLVLEPSSISRGREPREERKCCGVERTARSRVIPSSIAQGTEISAVRIVVDFHRGYLSACWGNWYVRLQGFIPPIFENLATVWRPAASRASSSRSPMLVVLLTPGADPTHPATTVRFTRGGRLRGQQPDAPTSSAVDTPFILMVNTPFEIPRCVLVCPLRFSKLPLSRGRDARGELVKACQRMSNCMML